MGLIQKYIEVELSSKNINHYSNLGYEIPKIKRSNGKYVTPRGTKIMILTTDLMRGSSKKVNVKCDCCEKIKNIHYYTYSYCNHNGLYYCNVCSSTVLESGDKNPRWNPNLSDEDRANGRYNEEYILFIKNVFKRDNYICQCCGKSRNKDNIIIEAHHLDGFNWCIKKRTDINNGVTLCRNCHRDFHNKYGIGNNTKEQYEEWIGHALTLISDGITITSNRKVYCFENNKIYDSTLQVAKEINSNRTSVATACTSYKNWKNNSINKIKKSLKGFHYFWYDEYITLNGDDINNYLNYCKNTHFRKVICITTGKIFETIKNGADFYNIKSPIGITKCCQGKVNYYGKLECGTKLKWMYYDEYLHNYKK